MSPWFGFERDIQLLTEAFGYKAVVTPASGDHGVDVIAEKDGRRVAIQVKLFGDGRVGNDTVLRLLGGMRVYSATESLLITTGRLTKKAQEACRMSGTVYYDREELIKLCIRKAITLQSWCSLFDTKSETLYSLEPITTIGRDPKNVIAIPNDVSLSRQHFQLSRIDLNLVLTDLASSNGTLVNGVRVSSPTVLKYGDQLDFGRQKWIVEPI